MVRRNWSMNTALLSLGCRVLGLTYRWVTRVTQHAASCPLAGAVGCVLPSCVQGLAEPSSRWMGEGENKMIVFLGVGPPFVNPGV